LDSALYYYLFTERYTLVDNRAKNTFWHYSKVYYTSEEARKYPTLDKKWVDDSKAKINNGYRWDLSWGYDFDTALGTDNDGDMVYSYGMEDIDFDDKNVEIFREQDSTFFVRIRNLFGKGLANLYCSLEKSNAETWSSEHFIKEFDDWQGQFPEELWRLDIERKYIRPFFGTSIDNSKESSPEAKYLDNMANGRKKYQRRQYEKNQAIYMASKYGANQASGSHNGSNSYIDLRIKDVSNNLAQLALMPNYDITITPYTRMYLTVDYGTDIEPIRATEIKPYTFTKPSSLGDDAAEFIKIYTAQWLTSIGDLSATYPQIVSAGPAKKLKELIIGSDYSIGEGDEKLVYKNDYLETLTPDSCELLEKLNIQNVAGYT
jgi:hypothetical protein